MARNEFSRQTVEQGIEKDKEQTKELAQENENHVHDLETERRTLDSLEGGTNEGLEECIDRIKEAQDISAKEFQDGTDQVHEAHEEIDEHQNEITEGKERADTDVDNIQEAQSAMDSENASGSLEAAMESVQRDIEFLEQCDEQEELIEQESMKLHEEHQNRADTAMGGS